MACEHKKKVRICANAFDKQSALEALLCGADGIGLFRTEIMMILEGSLLDEQEQFAVYRATAQAAQGKAVTFRTLDFGGDKPLPQGTAIPAGAKQVRRGIRFCLENKALLKKQLRALQRAAVFGSVKLLLPMVTQTKEVLAAKELLEECALELRRECIPFKKVPIGVMIETPAAAVISDLLAKEAAFFSIGTNDLTAFTMAADRQNEADSELFEPLQPSVLRFIEMTIKNAKRAGISVGICGEAAASTELLPKLLEWGVDEISVNPPFVKEMKSLVEVNRNLA